MADWEFLTDGFRDPEAARENGPSGIEGATLARAVRAELSLLGFDCEEVAPEEFGWAFHATGPEGRYLLAFTLEPEAGGALWGRVAVSKRRSLGDRLRGLNEDGPNEALPGAVRRFLTGRPEIRGFRDMG